MPWLGLNLTQIVIGTAVLSGLAVLYYVLLVRAILQMLRSQTNQVLLFFSFLALVPSPFTVVMGVLTLIIWRLYKRTLPETL